MPLEIFDSANITIANQLLYRTSGSFQPFPCAIKVSVSKNIRFRGVHNYGVSRVNFDNTICDQTHGVELRQRDFGWLTLSGNAPAPRKPAPVSPVLEAGARVRKLADGFFDLSGGAVDPAGDFYFVDPHWQRIYKWFVATNQLSTVRDDPLDPINLAFDKAGNLMVLSRARGVVYTFKPGAQDLEVKQLEAVAAAPRPGMRAVLPVGDWRPPVDPGTGAPAPRSRQYLSPDGTTFISTRSDASDRWVSGMANEEIHTFGFQPVKPGEPFYYTTDWDMTTWRCVVGIDGNFTKIELFVQLGGDGVDEDASGNVYLAAGQIYVYNPSGKLIDTIEVPERPTQVVFGGKDGQTLFIASRNSLYSVRTKAKGRASQMPW